MGPVPPQHIDGYAVVEYGFFTEPVLPTGYLPPPDGRPPLEPVQNLALCVAEGVEGYYLLYCTTDWRYVTYSFDETREAATRQPLIEFGRDVAEWFAFPPPGAHLFGCDPAGPGLP